MAPGTNPATSYITEVLIYPITFIFLIIKGRAYLLQQESSEKNCLRNTSYKLQFHIAYL